MIISARKDIIESILINAQPFLERKDPTNITSHIYIDAKDNETTIRATDNEIGLEVKSDQFAVEVPGTFTVNGRKLLDIVRTLKLDNITFELEDEHLLIKQGKSKFKLPTFNHQEYPTFPSLDDKESITLDSISLIKSFKKINPAIDTNNPKFELNGALLDIKTDKTFIVGTDTRRLAVVELENSANSEISLIIPKKTITEIQKLFLDEIELYYNENHLIVKNEQFYLYSRLISGKFPDYQRIIPKTTKLNFNIDKKSFIDATKIITTISNDILITFDNNLITLKSLDNSNQEAQTEIEAPISIEEPFTFAVNSKFMLDFLSQIDTDNFNIGLNETTLPFLVSSQNFKTVIMPIIL